jgi:hypothetical protein
VNGLLHNLGVASLSAALNALAFELIRRRFPAGRPTARWEELTDEEYRRVQRMASLEPLLAVAFAGVLGYGSFLVYRALGAWLAPRPAGAAFFFRTEEWAWALLAMFSGLLLGGLVLLTFLRNHLGSTFDAYVSLRIRQTGFDSWAALRWLSWAAAVPGTVFLCLALGHSLAITESEIRYDPFWSLVPRRYRMADVGAVSFALHSRAPNGSVVARPHYEVAFRDGYRFSSGDVPADSSRAELEAIARFVSEKSGVPLSVPLSE